VSPQILIEDNHNNVTLWYLPIPSIVDKDNCKTISDQIFIKQKCYLQYDDYSLLDATFTQGSLYKKISFVHINVSDLCNDINMTYTPVKYSQFTYCQGEFTQTVMSCNSKRITIHDPSDEMRNITQRLIDVLNSDDMVSHIIEKCERYFITNDPRFLNTTYSVAWGSILSAIIFTFSIGLNLGRFILGSVGIKRAQSLPREYEIQTDDGGVYLSTKDRTPTNELSRPFLAGREQNFNHNRSSEEQSE